MNKDNKIEVKILTVPNGYTLDIHKGNWGEVVTR